MGEVLFAQLITACIVAHHNCLQELSLRFPSPEYLRLLGVRRLEASGVPEELIASLIQNGALLESVKIYGVAHSMCGVGDLAAGCKVAKI